MASNQPYNELGQILAEGGEIALGLAIAGGWSSEKIERLFGRRFEPMRPEDREELWRIARRGVAAAEEFAAMDPTEPLEPGSMPIVGQRAGQYPSGTRVFWIGDFSPDSGEHWYQRRGYLADYPSYDEFIAMLRELTREYWRKYKETAHLADEVPDEDIMVRPVYLEANF